MDKDLIVGCRGFAKPLQRLFHGALKIPLV
jgi:hypothetical protein